MLSRRRLAETTRVERELTDLEKQMVERGIQADVLFANPTITEVVNELSDFLADAIIQTSPAERDKRESLYYMHKGLMDLTGLLKDYSARRAQLEATEDEQQEDMFD